MADGMSRASRVQAERMEMAESKLAGSLTEREARAEGREAVISSRLKTQLQNPAASSAKTQQQCHQQKRSSSSIISKNAAAVSSAKLHHWVIEKTVHHDYKQWRT